MENICTVFGLGNFTKMPGTLGSIAGAFLGFFLLYFFPIQLVIIFFIILLSISLYAIKIYQKQVGKSDKSEITVLKSCALSQEISNESSVFTISGLRLPELGTKNFSL